jgi:hypothetical protein
MSGTANLIVGIAFVAIGVAGTFRAFLGLRETSPAGFRRVEPILRRLGVRMLPSDTPYWSVQMLASAVLFFVGLAMLLSVLL